MTGNPASVAPGADDLPMDRLRIRHAAFALGLFILLALAAVGLGRGLWSVASRSACPAGLCDASPPVPRTVPRNLPGAPATQPPGDDAVTDADAARALNRARPFVAGKVPAAPPFRFAGSAMDRERAVECLAAAQLYEAGTDPEGQRAVAQVVLNRVRHPAFPKRICDVVFQGSERVTGCQFTFTCDGALRRQIPQSWWKRARVIARAALEGSVYKRVGTATHYHTDWVYPYWSPKLDKLAQVDTHIFFRWPGYWGSRQVLSGRYAGGEPLYADLVERKMRGPQAAAVNAGATAIPADPLAEVRPDQPDLSPPNGLPASALRGSGLKVIHPDGGAYMLSLRPGGTAEEYLGVAMRLCGQQNICRVMGWADAGQVPPGFPVSPRARGAMTFLYAVDGDKGQAKLQYDCRLFPRADRSQCL